MQAQVSNKVQASVSKLIAKAWFDKDFYNRFVNETAAVLREAGLAIEAIVNPNANGEAGVKLAANGAFQINLPAAPQMGDEHLYGNKQNNRPALDSFTGKTPMALDSFTGKTPMALDSFTLASK